MQNFYHCNKKDLSCFRVGEGLLQWASANGLQPKATTLVVSTLKLQIKGGLWKQAFRYIKHMVEAFRLKAYLISFPFLLKHIGVFIIVLIYF
jgi:hypothetical protein